MIDLRSDVVTKPTPAMLEAMMSAQVGNSLLNEDPTVLALEQRLAKMFGMQSALYLPSATMANQIAIKIATQPTDEVICEVSSHVYRHEGGGMAYNSHVSVRPVLGDYGRLSADDILENLNPACPNVPQTTLVCLENTANHGGGACYDFNEIKKISQLCKQKNMSLHLDGARLFNALVETPEKAADYGPLFNTITICFSKSLGCPMGSILLGSETDIQKARKYRGLWGGGMRQVGYMAAACLYALDHNIERLKEDHQRAKVLEQTLQQQGFELYPVRTNIVIFKTNGDIDAQEYSEVLKEKGILCSVFGKKDIRLVTHLDFNDSQLDQAVEIIKQL